MANDEHVPTLRLADLRDGRLPGVTGATGGSYAEAACVCLHTQGHPADLTIQLDGDIDRAYRLEWEAPTTQVCACHNDSQYATEHGAYAVSFLTVLDVTDFTVIRQSRKGTGFDWFLGYKDKLFQDAARLEVSGILNGSSSQLASRVKEKLLQTKPSDATRLPAYISVTEFGTPRTRLVKKT